MLHVCIAGRYFRQAFHLVLQPRLWFETRLVREEGSKRLHAEMEEVRVKGTTDDSAARVAYQEFVAFFHSGSGQDERSELQLRRADFAKILPGRTTCGALILHSGALSITGTVSGLPPVLRNPLGLETA